MAGRLSFSEPTSLAGDGPRETKSSRVVSLNTPSEAAGATNRALPKHSELGTKEISADRSTRLESIVRAENALDRNRALLAYIDQLGPGDFEDAVARFRSLGITQERMGEYSLLLTAWAQEDPTAALSYAQANTSSGFAQDTILSTWATTDPDAAIRWAQSNFSGDGANPFLPGIIRGLAANDPQKATTLLTSMPRSVERGEGLDYLMPQILQQGSDATMAWIAAITDESLKNGAIMRSAEKLGEIDPAGTIAWLIANPGEGQQRRLDDVYSSWASNDMAAAMSSFTNLPAGENRSNALRGLVTTTAVSDVKAAVNLMDQYPADVTDRAVQQLIWHSFGDDPATAATQIARITDEGRRDEMYRRTLDAWIERDPGTAQSWIQNHSLPESVQNHLLRRQAEQQATP